ncbi:MAG TPA: thiol reductant ABC exporter subunit CydC [Micromonosporaceae bacterium]
MRVLDRRLLRTCPPVRGLIRVSLLLEVGRLVLVVVQAVTTAQVGVGLLDGRLEPAWLAVLGAAVVARTTLNWLGQAVVDRSAADAVGDLRLRLTRHMVALGSVSAARQSTGEFVTLLSRGVEEIRRYLAMCLPQAIRAWLAPPLILCVLLFLDPRSALLVAVTLPLMPLLAAVIGLASRVPADRQWAVMLRMSGQFLDTLSGALTLRLFGREQQWISTLGKLSDDHRRTTVATLRVTFLSGLVLDAIVGVSIALAGAGLALRVWQGELAAQTALAALLIIPEAYLVIRQLGSQYHATAEGTNALRSAYQILDTSPPETGHAGPAAVPAPDHEPVRRTSPVTVAASDLVVEPGGSTGPRLRFPPMRAEPGRLTAITGPSGSGKSTLLRTLLGHHRPLCGEVTFETPGGAQADPSWGCCAWLAQHSAVLTATIRDNIRLSRPAAAADQVRAAAAAAGASEFIEQLPEGYGTCLDERGAPLSTGQRRRVALARAILAERKVMLLDEPTAGLDAPAEAHIVTTLRRLARVHTVVVVSHSPAVLAAADDIVRLGGPGGYGVSTPATSPATEVTTATDDPVPTQQLATTQSVRAIPSLLSWTRVGSLSGVVAVLAGSAALLSGVALTGVVVWLVGAAAGGASLAFLTGIALAARTLGLGRGALHYLERLSGHDMALRVVSALRTRLFRQVARGWPGPGATTHRGDLLARLVGDVEAVQVLCLRGILMPVAALSAAVAVTVVGWLLSPVTGLLIGLAVLLSLTLSVGVASWLGRPENAAARLRGDLAVGYTELVTTLPELTLWGGTDAALNRLRRGDATLSRLVRRSAFRSRFGESVTTVVAGGAAIATAVSAGDGGLGPLSTVALLFVVLVALPDLLVPLAPSARAVREGLSAVHRVNEVLRTPPQIPEPVPAVALPTAPYHLRLTAARVRWHRDGQDVLHGVDLDLTPGRRIAVVGPSGSGKSTLLATLARLVAVGEGRYRVNGVDVARVPGEQFCQVVGLSGTDSHVFAATIETNLRIGFPDASEQRLWQVLDAVGLAGWVASLPESLCTPIGEGGQAVSGGQRQRLVLARALLAQAPVLLLDEPVEHLDSLAAEALLANVLDATSGRTLVLATHHVHLLTEMDEILVLMDGRVVQRGGHSELFETSGPYRRLLDRCGSTMAGAPAVAA